MTPILLTGGAGYIGSHTAVALQAAGFQPLLLDNFSNSHPAVLGRLAKILGSEPVLERGDVRDRPWLMDVLRRHRPAGVIHLAGFKAVGESVVKPLAYYDNNVGGTVLLLQALQEWAQEQGSSPIPLVFSSSATVYGYPQTVPIPESAARSATNPYGHTKLVIEDILSATAAAQPGWAMAILRYFNPVGAHGSGMIGEDPKGIPNNLMPFVTQVAVGRRERLSVFGSNYLTVDGTGVRDYIHVMDLAEGHVAALRHLLSTGRGLTVNLGTGKGTSVLQLVAAFEQASGRPVPYALVDRRPGDVAACYADPTRARELLGWQARRDLEAICLDAWRWQSGNPDGYGE